MGQHLHFRRLFRGVEELMTGGERKFDVYLTGGKKKVFSLH